MYRSRLSHSKHRPVFRLILLTAAVVLSCGVLSACQPAEESETQSASILAPYPLQELDVGEKSLLIDGREILTQVVPKDTDSAAGSSNVLRLLSRDPATGEEFRSMDFGMADTDWEGTGLFPFSDLMGYNGFLLRYRENDIHTIYRFFILNESGFSSLFDCQDDVWVGDLDGDGQAELLTRSGCDYDNVILYHRTGGQEVWAYPSIDLEEAARDLLDLPEDAPLKLMLQDGGTLLAHLPHEQEDQTLDSVQLMARVLELHAAPTDTMVLQNLNLDGLGGNDDTLTVTSYRRSEFCSNGLITVRAHLGTGAEPYWEYPSDYWLKDVHTVYLTSLDKQTVILELPYARSNWEGADYFLLDVKYGGFRESGCMTGDPDGPLAGRSLTGSAPSVFGPEIIDRTDSPLKALRVPTYVDKWEDYIWYTLTWDDETEQFRCEPQS